MIKKPNRKALKDKKRLRVRKKVTGTQERPRLSVFRSLQHVYAQVINDETGATLAAASTLSEELKGQFGKNSNIEASKAVGALIAQKAIEKGVKQVVFDRGGYLYHGRIAALAQAAREGGLEF